MAKEKELKLCESGSGQTTNGGTFAPGGDAKYKSALINRVIEGDPTPAEVKAETQRLLEGGYDEDYIENRGANTVTAAKARAIIKARGWDGFLARKVAIVKVKATAKAEREKAKAAKAKEAAKVKSAKKAAAAKAPKAGDASVEEDAVA